MSETEKHVMELEAKIAQQDETIRLQSNLDPDAFFRFVENKQIAELREKYSSMMAYAAVASIFALLAMAGLLATLATLGVRVVVP